MLLGDAENRGADEFMMAHYEGRCLRRKKMKVAAVEVKCTATGIGLHVLVKCPNCGKTKDVTDYGSW